MKKTAHFFKVTALFFLTLATCDAAPSDSTGTAIQVNTSTSTPHQGMAQALGNPTTAVATNDSSGGIASSCPAGSVYRNVSFNNQSVFLYNPTGGPAQCVGEWVWRQCQAGEFQDGVSCWCEGSPNSCCNYSGLGGRDCNSRVWNPCARSYPTASGTWQNRSTLPPGTNTNAPSVFSGGSCVSLGWTNTS